MKMFKQFLEESDKLEQILVDWVSEHIGAITDLLDSSFQEEFNLGQEIILDNQKLFLSDQTRFDMDDKVYWLGLLGWGEKFSLPKPLSVGEITTNISGWDGFDHRALLQLTDVTYVYFVSCDKIPIDEIVDMSRRCNIVLHSNNESFIGSFMKLINNPNIDIWESSNEELTDVEKAFGIISRLKKASGHIDEFEFQSAMIDAELEHLL